MISWRAARRVDSPFTSPDLITNGAAEWTTSARGRRETPPQWPGSNGERCYYGGGGAGAKTGFSGAGGGGSGFGFGFGFGFGTTMTNGVDAGNSGNGTVTISPIS